MHWCGEQFPSPTHPISGLWEAEAPCHSFPLPHFKECESTRPDKTLVSSGHSRHASNIRHLCFTTCVRLYLLFSHVFGTLTIQATSIYFCRKREKQSWHIWQSKHAHKLTQPPTVAWKVEAQSEYVHVACTFFCTFGADFVCSVGACWQKLLHRSSGGSLLRVRCWLGRFSRLNQVKSVANLAWLLSGRGKGSLQAKEGEPLYWP